MIATQVLHKVINLKEFYVFMTDCYEYIVIQDGEQICCASRDEMKHLIAGRLPERIDALLQTNLLPLPEYLQLPQGQPE